MFGPARSTVPYVDCTRADGARGFSDECKAKGITVVPSWSVPGIGTSILPSTTLTRTLATVDMAVNRACVNRACGDIGVESGA